jgi:nucleotide-binding universal stress UspA family protein
MFKRLLVPLDGSNLAEGALPAAAYLAQTLAAPVILIHVIERDAPKVVHGERHLTNEAEANAYLNQVAASSFPSGVQVEPHVHTSAVSDVADSIAEHVKEFGTDLIIMCTHGHGGLRRWLFGPIAQQVIALGKTPVLLIQPDEGTTEHTFACRRLLVPLDGNPDHEQGLLVAEALAQVYAANLHLVSVIQTLDTLSGQRAATAKMLPGTTSVLLDLKQQSAVAYLQQQVNHLQTAGITTTAEVARGDPAKLIVRAAQQVKADLIVLGTHGKSNLDAFWSGSVTPKIAGHTHTPLLLVPCLCESDEPENLVIS